MLILAARQAARSQCTAAGRALGVGLVLPPTRERDAGERKLEREREGGKRKRKGPSLLLARTRVVVVELRERKGKDKPTVFIFFSHALSSID